MCRWVGEEARQAELDEWWRLLRRSVAFTLPVFITAMILPALPFMRPILQQQVLGFPLQEVVKWAFTTPVQFWIGARFHMGAWRALRNGRCASQGLICMVRGRIVQVRLTSTCTTAVARIQCRHIKLGA